MIDQEKIDVEIYYHDKEGHLITTITKKVPRATISKLNMDSEFTAELGEIPVGAAWGAVIVAETEEVYEFNC